MVEDPLKRCTENSTVGGRQVPPAARDHLPPLSKMDRFLDSVSPAHLDTSRLATVEAQDLELLASGSMKAFVALYATEGLLARMAVTSTSKLLHFMFGCVRLFRCAQLPARIHLPHGRVSKCTTSIDLAASPSRQCCHSRVSMRFCANAYIVQI